MNRETALAIVKKYVKNVNLVNHMLCVEACMRFYAFKFGQDEEYWAICGLLHDFDWEIHPTADLHPMAGKALLEAEGVPDDIVQAVLSHADHTGIPRTTLMEKTLYACDEITGLVTASALVRPSRSISDLEVSSVKKKWKDKGFAAGANRDEMVRGAEELGIDLWEHVNNVILAIRSIATTIGLAGKPEKEDGE